MPAPNTYDRAVTPHATHATSAPPVHSSRPHPWEMVIHPFKTLHFVEALRTEPRISLWRKLLYVGPLLVLLVALLLPETIIATLVAAILPVVGPAVNLPTDAVLDWAFLGIAAYGLLGILPRAIISEHHARLFHPKRIARQQQRQLSQRR